jgi:separase
VSLLLNLSLVTSQAFLDCAFALTSAFMSRGSAKDAQAIIEQVQDVAEAIGSPYIAARAACQAAEVQIHLNDMDGAKRNIDLAAIILAQVNIEVAIQEIS